MKKCKTCNGMGFTFNGVEYISKGFWLQAVNKKETCKKCHGKGFK